MYQRFPGGTAQSHRSAQANTPAPVPRSVRRAVRAMYIGAAVTLLGIVIDLATLSSLRSAIVKANPHYTAAQIASAEHGEIGLLIAGGLIGAALWFWMAHSCRAGKSWARIVSTVLFGIDTLSMAVGASALAGGGLTRFYGLITWAIGLVTVVLLWQRSSSGYFRAPRD